MDNRKKRKKGHTFLKENRTFKVSPDLKTYLENVLKRANIKFKNNGDGTISAPISGELFHKFVIRARCEKTDFEKEGFAVTVPHIHVSELDNPHVMRQFAGYSYKVVGEKR